MGQYFTIAGMMFLLQNAFELLTPISFTGTTTMGSTAMTAVSSTAGLEVGQLLAGPGLADGTTIAAIGTGALTLSAAATTAESAETFYAFGTETQTLPLTLHLLTGAVPQGPTVDWSALTEATYDGYAPVELSTAPFILSAPKVGFITASAPCVAFVPTDYTVPNTITGQAWTFPGGGDSGPQLVATEAYAPPINLSEPGDLIRVIPVLSFALNCTAGEPSPIL